MQKTLLSLALACGIAFAGDATQFIQSKDGQIQALVKADPKITPATEAKVRETLLSLFDAKLVAQQSLGAQKKLWAANPALQERYAKALSDLIVRQNISVLRRNGTISSTFSPAKPSKAAPKAMEVQGISTVKGVKKPVSYIVVPAGSDWKAMDVKAGPASTYGTVVQSLLKKNKNDLGKTIADLEAAAKRY